MYKLTDYIKITEVNSTDPLILDAVGVCKRVKNKKRDFLFLNRHQGKHFPISPSTTLAMYDELCDLANAQFEHESIAIVGFSETATAIGYFMASELKGCQYVLKTTRELYDEVAPLVQFTEVHSHAPSQLLYGDLDKLRACDRIVFVEDEITTGNTILNFIRTLSDLSLDSKYGVISILNWQSKQDSKRFDDLCIPTVCLLRGNLINTTVAMPNAVTTQHTVELPANTLAGERFGLTDPLGFGKQRDGVGETVFNAIELRRWFDKESKKPSSRKKDVLVLGTEEFMYIPLQIANFIEKNIAAEVAFHATTRSPIQSNRSSDEYAINCSEVVTSPYADRETYIYNLKKYDKVIVITDAPDNSGKFRQSMTDTLSAYGNSDIMFIRLIDKDATEGECR